MKKIKRLLIAVVLLLVVAVVAVFFYIDAIAKAGIEKGATYALGVETTLDGVSLGIFKGKFGMDQLSVKNPAGFSSPHFFALGRGEVEVTIQQLMGEKVQVVRIAFKDIDVHLEKSKGKTNYAVIMENLKKLESKSEETVEQESGTSKKFVIELVDIQNINVHVNLVPEIGDLTKLDIKIPALTLKGIGSDTEGGALLADVSDVILKAIIQAVVDKGGLPADMLGDLQGHLAKLENLDKFAVEVADKLIGDTTKKVTAEIDKVTKDATKDLLKDGAGGLLKDKTKDLGKGIGDLFGKDKK